MIIEMSAAIAAFAFVALVAYAIVIFHALRQTLHQVDLTAIEIRKQLEETGGQAKKTIEHTNQLGFDLKTKIDSLNPIFNALSNVGDILEYKTCALRKEALTSLHQEPKLSGLEDSLTEQHEESRIADLLELAGIGIRLWQKIKHKHLPVSKNKEKEIFP